MAGGLQSASRARSVRERILETSYELFSQRGIRAVGVDELIERAGVAKASLYRHFPSKDDLVVAFLERREQRWTNGWVEKEARGRASSPEKQLLAIFDAFDEWFRREDFEACSFINVLLELGPRHRAGSASVRHLENIRSIVRGRPRRRATSPVDGPPSDRRPPLTAQSEVLAVAGIPPRLRLVGGHCRVVGGASVDELLELLTDAHPRQRRLAIEERHSGPTSDDTWPRCRNHARKRKRAASSVIIAPTSHCA
jgi:AcrR family transcriptional regulator